MRWAKGYLQVFRVYGGRMLRGMFRKGGFACYDMTMAIMPAIVLTLAGMVVNVAAAVVCTVSGQGPGGSAVVAGGDAV